MEDVSRGYDWSHAVFGNVAIDYHAVFAALSWKKPAFMLFLIEYSLVALLLISPRFFRVGVFHFLVVFLAICSWWFSSTLGSVESFFFFLFLLLTFAVISAVARGLII